MASLLLDTCAAIWLMSGSVLAPPARRSIREAVNSDDGCSVSPITAWEVATLAVRRRIDLTMTPEAWFHALLALPGFRLAELHATGDVAAVDVETGNDTPREHGSWLCPASNREMTLQTAVLHGRAYTDGHPV